MKLGSIYIIKNTINEKVYVGQTTMTVRERFKNHLKPSVSKRNVNRKLYNAIAKHGADNFYVETLETNIPIDDLDNREIYYINKFNSYKKGYNSTYGGDGRIINKLNNEEELLDLARNGTTAEVLAEKYNVDKVTVFRTLHKLGFYYRKEITEKELSELIDKGYSNKELAMYFDVDVITISRARDKYGLKAYKKKVRYRDEFNYEGFKRDYKAGMDRTKLCELYDVSKTTMYRIADKFDLDNDAIVSSADITKQIVELKENGTSIKDISKKFGIKEKAIYARISNYKKSVETREQSRRVEDKLPLEAPSNSIELKR